jgi:hypothetical protein
VTDGKFEHEHETNLSMHQNKKEMLKFMNQNPLAAACQPGSWAMPKFAICHPIMHLGKK